MPDYIYDALMKNIQHFFAFWMIYVAYTTAKSSAEAGTRFRTFLMSLAWCGGIAGVYAVSIGQASCVDSDPMRGTCMEYGDDGYTPRIEERIQGFVSIFSLIFFPAVVGCLNAVVFKKEVSNAEM